MSSQGMSRRRTLLAGAAFSTHACVLPGNAFAETIRRRMAWAAGQSDRPQRIDARPGYLFLTPTEAAFIEAAIARLIPSDPVGPGAIEAAVPRFIDRQLAGPMARAIPKTQQGASTNRMGVECEDVSQSSAVKSARNQRCCL